MSCDVGYLTFLANLPDQSGTRCSDKVCSRYRGTLEHISLISFTACRKGRSASPTGVQHDLRNEGIVRHHHSHSPEEGLEVVRQL